MYTRLLDASVLREMRDAFECDPARPVQIFEVIESTVAEAVADALQDAHGWVEEHFVEEVLGAIRCVDGASFLAAPERGRFARLERLVAQTYPAQLAAILDELASRKVVDAFRNLGPCGVASPRFKITRYRPGDFFSSHTDGNTGIAVLAYLTRPDWVQGDGGNLIYEDEAGTVAEFPPTFNSAVVFPYRANAVHSVSAVAEGAGLRYTICADYA